MGANSLTISKNVLTAISTKVDGSVFAIYIYLQVSLEQVKLYQLNFKKRVFHLCKEFMINLENCTSTY